VSVFRQLLPVLSDLIESGAADALFDLLAVMTTIQTPDARGQTATLADVLIDATAFALAERDVRTRQGTVARTSLAAALLDPAITLVDRASAAPSGAGGRILDHVTGYLRPDAQGRLAHRGIIPLATVLLDGIVEVWRLDRARRDCYVDALQADAQDVLTSPAFATLVRLGRLLDASPHRPAIEQALVTWLDAVPTNPAAVSVYGPLLQVTAALLSSRPPVEALDQLLRFVGVALDPARVNGVAVLRTFDTLLEGDRDQVFLGMLRRSVAPGPGGLVPLEVLLDGYTPALSISPAACTPENSPWSARGLDQVMKSLVGFMRDPTYGLPAIFDALAAFLAGP
jgi:hypothetical protein